MDKKIIIIWIVIIIAIIGIVSYSKNKNTVGETGTVTTTSISQNKGPVDLSQTVVVDEKNSEKTSDGEIINTSSKLREEKTFDGLKFTNIKLAKQDGNTMLIADVENNSGKDLSSGQKVIVVFKDSTGKEIEQVESLLPTIKNGAKGQLNTNVLTDTDDIVNAYDFEIKEAK